jgi:hypothetical protein
MLIWMKLKLAAVILQLLALVAVFVWIGGPGPDTGVLLAMAAWRYYLWEDRG